MQWLRVLIIEKNLHKLYRVMKMNIDKNKLKIYGTSIGLTLIVGGISSLLSNIGMESYKAAEKPALTPPDILFPIVWTILYILMGISAARIWQNGDSKQKAQSLRIYLLQLAFNFVWSLLFFNMQAYGFALVWLIILWLLILLMILSFSKIDKPSAYLQIPYLLWVSFAAYLNFMVWMLNK